LIRVLKKPELNLYRQAQYHGTTYFISLLADDKYLYGGTVWNDCSIKVYDKSNFDVKTSLEGHLGTVFTLVQQRHHLYSGSGDSRVIIWNRDDWGEVGSFSGQRHFVLSLAADEKYIYAGGIDDCTNVFTQDDYTQVISLEGHDANVLSLASDDAYLYSGSGELWWGGPGSPRPPRFESAVRVWDKRDWSCIAVLKGHSDNVNAIVTDAQFVYSVSDDSTLRVYAKKDWAEKLCLKVDATRILSMAIDVSFVYIGCSDGSIRQLQKTSIGL
jgi:hypothetical protein